MKYIVWNNKGGVGKTFLTFVLASQYAKLNKDKKVVVIDMCPQANISEILLGGNGKGSANLDKILNDADRKTIGGYFDKRISRPDEKTGDESNFILKCDDHADSLPENLYLVAGDPSLELQVQSINQAASQDLPENRWKNVHFWLKDLQDGIMNRFNNNVTFFIDCNPSFATYTAQAIVASDRLIIPCTADGSSARAIDNVSQLLYGVGTPSKYTRTNFAYKAEQNGITLPSIYLVVLNRATISSDKPAAAFRAMYGKIKERVNKLKKLKSSLFTPFSNATSLPDEDGDVVLQLRDNFINMPDAHTVAIVSSYFAQTIDSLEIKSYDLDGQSTQVNRPPLDRYKKAITSIVGRL